MPVHTYLLSYLGVSGLLLNSGIGAAIVCPSLLENGFLWFEYILIDSMESRDSYFKWAFDDLPGFPEFLTWICKLGFL